MPRKSKPPPDPPKRRSPGEGTVGVRSNGRIYAMCFQVSRLTIIPTVRRLKPTLSAID